MSSNNRLKVGTLFPNIYRAEKQQGTMGAWVTKIVDNIQITIKDVHMRYEDEVTDPKVCNELEGVNS